MNLIGQHQLVLQQKDTFTSKSFEFDVPQGAEKLKITWNYKPRGLTDIEQCERIAEESMKKYLPEDAERKVLFDSYVGKITGLKNQLDFTLYSPKGFCGNANGYKSIVELTNGSATPGFLPGVPHGRCTIVVSVFCVYTDQCQVDFTMEVE